MLDKPMLDKPILDEKQYDAEVARINMAEQMLRPWNILNQRVLDVFKTLPRDKFVPQAYQDIAYSEVRIPLNKTVKMLSPIIEGRFLQELRIEPEERILVIGSGSGFLAACAKALGNEVVGVDLDPEMIDYAKDIYTQLGIEGIKLHTLDVAKYGALEPLGEFDVIIVTGSLSQVPTAWFNSLRDGGTLLAAVGKEYDMSATLHYKYGEAITTETIFETQLEPLLGFEPKEEFVF